MANFSDLASNSVWSVPMSVRISVVAILGLIILTGIVGNLLVLLLIVLVKSLQTVVNCSLAMMCLADLIILTLLPVLPIGVELAKDDSHVGSYLCDFLNCYDRGAVVFSVLIYIFVTLDRYFAVCHPLRSLQHNRKATFFLAMFVITAITTFTSVPYRYMSVYEGVVFENETYHQCYITFDKTWMVTFETVMNVTVFFLPLPFLLALNCCMVKKIREDVPGKNYQQQKVITVPRAKRQVVRMLMVVVSIFIICQWPFAILILLDLHSPGTVQDLTRESNYALYWAARILIYINSAANPFVYFLTSTKFRRAFVTTFCCYRRRKSKIVDKCQRGIVGWEASAIQKTTKY